MLVRSDVVGGGHCFLFRLVLFKVLPSRKVFRYRFILLLTITVGPALVELELVGSCFLSQRGGAEALGWTCLPLVFSRRDS